MRHQSTADEWSEIKLDATERLQRQTVRIGQGGYDA